MIPRSPATRGAWTAFLATLPVYLVTMNRTIGFVDRGELAAVAATFGIPHPTGYPTLMLVAGALTRVVPLRPVLVLNAFAAVLTALGVAVLALLLDRVLSQVTETLSAGARAALASLSALFVGLTVTWWQQSNGFEVYALHLVLMPLVVLLFLSMLDAAGADAPLVTSPRTRRAEWMFALVVGLSFTNHATTALLAPGLLIAFLMRFGIGPDAWRRMLRLAPPFLLGLLPYLWLPLRSSWDPRFDWGNTETLQGFLYHVRGGAYHHLLFTQPAAIPLQARYLAWRLPSDFLWVGLPIAGLGAALLVQRSARLTVMAVSFVVAGLVFSVGYSVLDLDAYLLTTLLGLSMCFAVGMARVHQRFGQRAAILLAVTLTVGSGLVHWRECDERRNRLVEGLVTDLLGPLPPNAVLVTNLWDFSQSAACYFQEVEGFRRDVVVVSTHQIWASWYLDELERRVPDLVARSRQEFEAYRDTLREIEAGLPTSFNAFEAGGARFFGAFVAGCMRDRPVFATGGIPGVGNEVRRVPWHLALWLRTDSTYVPERPWNVAFRPWHGRTDAYTSRLCQMYADARVERANYESRHGRDDRAAQLIRGAQDFDPRIRPERIAPLPLGADQEVVRSARFFRDLRALESLSARH